MDVASSSNSLSALNRTKQRTLARRPVHWEVKPPVTGSIGVVPLDQSQRYDPGKRELQRLVRWSSAFVAPLAFTAGQSGTVYLPLPATLLSAITRDGVLNYLNWTGDFGVGPSQIAINVSNYVGPAASEHRRNSPFFRHPTSTCRWRGRVPP